MVLTKGRTMCDNIIYASREMIDYWLQKETEDKDGNMVKVADYKNGKIVTAEGDELREKQ